MSVGDHQNFAFQGHGTADRTVAQGEIKFYHYAGNTYAVGNTTADNTADFKIEIVGTHSLSDSNFIALV